MINDSDKAMEKKKLLNYGNFTNGENAFGKKWVKYIPLHIYNAKNEIFQISFSPRRIKDVRVKILQCKQALDKVNLYKKLLILNI
ncbi:MAG: hypothetical protein R2821_06135 [Flavobacteriaceae bacterium]